MDIILKEKKLNKLFLLVLVFNIIFVSIFICPEVKAEKTGSLKIDQELEINIGNFEGEKELYNNYNEGSLPSLSPHVDYETKVKGTISTTGKLNLDFLLSGAGNKNEYLDLSYCNYGIKIGNQKYFIPVYGFNYSKNLEGMKGYYETNNVKGEIFKAVKKSKYTEVEFSGNDSPGPYFVGHKDVLPNSEQVYVNGIKQDRGEGPDDKDYYIDYEGGFLYFNKIILSHEKIKITYDYKFDEEEYSGSLNGGDLLYNVNDKIKLRGFYLNDSLPLKKESIFKEAGYESQSSGVSIITKTDNYQSKNTIIFSNLKKYLSKTLFYEENLIVTPQNQNKEFELEHNPVLYESEKLITEEGEELERNLDYRVMYGEGKVIFNTNFKETKVLKIDYEYIDESADKIDEAMEGIKSSNLINYDNGQFESFTEINYYDGEFTDFKWQKEISKKLTISSEDKYKLSQNWNALFNIDYEDKKNFIDYDSDLGFGYSHNNLDSLFKYNRSYNEKENITSNSLKTEFNYDFSLLEFSVSTNNKIPSETLKPEKYDMSIKGKNKKFEYQGDYRHGYGTYVEEVGLNLCYTHKLKQINLINKLDNSYYFKDNFSDDPKRITIFNNKIKYMGDKYYINSNLKYRESDDMNSKLHQTNYNLETNYRQGKDIFINNQLEYESISSSEEKKNSLNNLLVYSHQINKKINVTTQLGAEYSKNIKDSDRSLFKKYYYNLEMNYIFSKYDLSLNLFEKEEQNIYKKETEKNIEQKLKGVINYDFNLIDLTGELSFTRYNYELLKTQIKFKPSRKINEEVEIWGEYKLELMNDWNTKTLKYKTNQLFMGITYKL